MVFQGNEGLDSGTLRAFITARGLDPVAWSEPERIEEALAELYRSRGWLEAGVVAGRPVFESTEARLPIEIDEGRLFAIESVRLSGVSSRPEHAARDTLGLTSGEPYREGEVQAGRAALERSYRSEGFNAARVAARSTIDTAAGTVVVDISVSEGLQQIIQEVVVEGAARSHPTLVASALRFTPGDVVDLSEWNLGAYTVVRHRRLSPGGHPGGAGRAVGGFGVRTGEGQGGVGGAPGVQPALRRRRERP